MLDKFPYTQTITEPRQIQIDCLNWIEQHIHSKKLAICAPVGVGKSVIGLTVLRTFSNGLYTSPLNALVDQLDENFKEYVKTLKGRKHYLCAAGKDNCAIGYCKVPNTCQFDGGIRQFNPHQDKCKDCECNECLYKKAFRQFKIAELGNTNFTLFLLGITNSPVAIIIDEADQIEDFVRLHYTYTFNTKIRKTWENTLIDLEDYQNALNKELTMLFNRQSVEQSKKKPMKFSLDSFNIQIDKINMELGHILTILDDYESFNEEWVVSQKGNQTTFQPVTTSRFIEPLLKGKLVVLMSATLSPSLKNEGYNFYEVDSPFNPKIRPWKFIPIGRMSKDYREHTMPKVVKHLIELPVGKTIVHCHSYDIAKSLHDLLNKHEVYPFLQTKHGVETKYKRGVSRLNAINEFKSSKDPREILLSVNLTRGIDLYESDITNNIIVVLPFANPTDPLVRKKRELLGKKQEAISMMQVIEQAYGRVNRNNDKTTNTEILDSNWRWWFREHKHLFNNWFLEAEVK